MKQFVRRKEDFICSNCHTKVIGDGYTNHCPKCLWSKHVDINPGDREEVCQGLMKPVGIILRSGDYYIHHVCVQCGFKRNNKTSPGDCQDTILNLT